MPLSDLAPAELRAYRPEVTEPAYFDTFRARTLLGLRQDADPVMIPMAPPLKLVDACDVTFAGVDLAERGVA